MNKIDEIIHGMNKENLPSDYWITNHGKLSELDASHFVIQNNGQSVFEHTMLIIDILTIKNHITLLSGLFHDLGKSFTEHYKPSHNYRSSVTWKSSRFAGHADESAKIAHRRLTQWGTNPYIIDRVVRIISTHMFDISNIMGEKTIRKFVADIGKDNIENWFVVRIADSRSYAAQRQYQNCFIEPFRRKVMSYLEKQPNPGQPLFEQSDETRAIQIEGRDDK